MNRNFFSFPGHSVNDVSVLVLPLLLEVFMKLSAFIILLEVWGREAGGLGESPLARPALSPIQDPSVDVRLPV